MTSSFYLPILKSKTGEKKALRELEPLLKTKVVPLIELVKCEKQKKGVDKKTTYIPVPDSEVLSNELISIKRYLPDINVFLDTKMLIDIDRETAVSKIQQRDGLFDSKVLPVIYLDELENTFSKVTTECLFKNGFCLRVLGENLPKLQLLKIESELKKKIHLVIDFGITSEFVESVIPLLNNIGFVNNWKSITLVSGAFPKDLSSFSVDKVDTHPRQDWLSWNVVKNRLTPNIGSFNYGDYTIRHPIFENVHNPNTSFSFRYTGNEKWFVFRGFSRKAKNFPGDIQYRAHALTLVEGGENYEYSGEEFSLGDRYIKSKAKLVDEVTNKQLNENCGTSTTWLQAGVNHHICKVVDQLGI